jgi:hypothetical protein
VSQLETFTVMVVSTAHLSKDVAEQMDKIVAARAGEGWPDVHAWQYWVVAERWSTYGWWVWAGIEDGIEDLPPCLRNVLKYAQQRDIRWVQFDCDAGTIEELPTWEW